MPACITAIASPPKGWALGPGTALPQRYACSMGSLQPYETSPRDHSVPLSNVCKGQAGGPSRGMPLAEGYVSGWGLYSWEEAEPSLNPISV